MNTEQFGHQWGQIVAKAWQDEKFKKRLLAEPAAVLQQYGMEMPAGVQVRVQEDTHEILHLTIPPKPSSQELSDAELDGVAGGLFCGLCFGGGNRDSSVLKKMKDASPAYKELPSGWESGQTAAPVPPGPPA